MKVAVLLPVFNGEKTIEKAVYSLLEQTYKNHELYLVDNNCTDKTVKLVYSLMRDYDPNSWDVLTCKPKGIVPALNKGLFEIMSSDADLIARLDADDVWHPTKLEKQVKFLEENPDIHIVGTHINQVKNGTFIGEFKYPTTDEDIKRMLFLGHNSIAHPSVMFRPEVILRTGGYDNTYPIAEDYHLWLKAATWFNFANLDEVLVDYNVSHNPAYNPKTPQACCIAMRTALSFSKGV